MSEPASSEEIVFQLTMPGFEEELFYRGILLFALSQAFTDRIRFLGVDWGRTGERWACSDYFETVAV